MEAVSVRTSDTGEDYVNIPAWVVQYNPRSAQELLRSWLAGEDFEYPAVDRHTDDIHEGDFVLFWVSGPGDKAGIIGWGVASGVTSEVEHPKNYQDPHGPKALRNSAEVALAGVFDAPIVTRDELKKHPEFADFTLFKMSNRSNAFEVTREQWEIVFSRLEEVLGR